MADDVSDWAIERALSESGMADGAGVADVRAWRRVGYTRAKVIHAFARYIEKHEQPPVDPLLPRAREIVAEYWEAEGKSDWAATVRGGGRDIGVPVQAALAGLRSGIELGRGEPA